MARLSLDSRKVAEILRAGVRPLGPAAVGAPSARVLARHSAPGISFLWIEPAPGLRRSFVLVEGALAVFDAAPEGELSWDLEGPAPLTCRTLAEPGRDRRGTASLLHLLSVQDVPFTAVRDLELSGLRLADRVILFHQEFTAARSALSFFLNASERLSYAIAGLSPGNWDVWWNGWLEQAQVAAPAILLFDGPGGSYFLRRAT